MKFEELLEVAFKVAECLVLAVVAAISFGAVAAAVYLAFFL